ncbi:plasmid recombination protein [Thiomonas sp.]|uniref:plasmid recombination protein n=1 Tax=Thiomonas sp. TaxID=2047785 RepID=UPI002590C4A4|nr:plasmid recombination protein [Thiomonas sp.]
MPSVSARLERVTARSAKGQRSHDLRLHLPSYASPEKVHLNRVLVPPATSSDLLTECNRRCAEAGRRGLQRGAAIGVRGIVTFSTDAILPDDPDVMDRHFRETAEAIASKLGTTVCGLVVHMDESRPHAHFTMHGYGHDGRSAGRKLDAKTLRQVQDLAGACWADLGITRGKPKRQRIEDGDPLHTIIHKSVRKLHHDLPRELEALHEKTGRREKELAALIERVEKMRDIVKKTPPPKPCNAEIIAEQGLIRPKTRRIKIMPLEDMREWYRAALVDIIARDEAAAAREKAAAVKLNMANAEYRQARDILSRASDLSKQTRQGAMQAEIESQRSRIPSPNDRPGESPDKPKPRG